VCDPLVSPDHGPHDHGAAERADDAHGHGQGGRAGMSMEAIVREMRNRFLVALIFTAPIVLWSTVGTQLLGSELATPFGIDRDAQHRPCHCNRGDRGHRRTISATSGGAIICAKSNA
jgi:Cu2+-exporting ATPase